MTEQALIPRHVKRRDDFHWQTHISFYASLKLSLRTIAPESTASRYEQVHQLVSRIRRGAQNHENVIRWRVYARFVKRVSVWRIGVNSRMKKSQLEERLFIS